MGVRGVSERVVDELADVRVGQLVEDVFAFPAPAHEADLAQQLQALGHGRQTRVLRVDELAHAGLAAGERQYELQPERIGECPQELGRALEEGDVGRLGRARWMLVGGYLHHFNTR